MTRSVFQDVNGDGVDELHNVVLLRRPHGGTDYQLLQDQNQYLLRYNTNTKQLTFDAASGVFPTGDYLVVLNTGQPVALINGQLTTDDTQSELHGKPVVPGHQSEYPRPGGEPAVGQPFRRDDGVLRSSSTRRRSCRSTM